MLLSKHFSEERQHFLLSGCVYLSQSFDEPRLVHGADLVEYDLPFFALKTAIHARRIGSSLCGHGGNNDGGNMLVHFIWRDDKAGSGFFDFSADGWVEIDKVRSA